jgi:hypothetical protein
VSPPQPCYALPMTSPVLLPRLSLVALAQVAREQDEVMNWLNQGNRYRAILALTNHLREQGLYFTSLPDCKRAVEAM